jgi:hypothetical protein
MTVEEPRFGPKQNKTLSDLVLIKDTPFAGDLLGLATN